VPNPQPFGGAKGGIDIPVPLIEIGPDKGVKIEDVERILKELEKIEKQQPPIERPRPQPTDNEELKKLIEELKKTEPQKK
jgi:hypothetical protein